MVLGVLGVGEGVIRGVEGEEKEEELQDNSDIKLQLLKRNKNWVNIVVVRLRAA